MKNHRPKQHRGLMQIQNNGVRKLPKAVEIVQCYVSKLHALGIRPHGRRRYILFFDVTFLLEDMVT